MTNNDIIRSLRYILNAKDPVRKKGHANYKDCGNQILRNLLRALAGSNKKTNNPAPRGTTG